MTRIKNGQKVVNKPVVVSKELHKYELDNVLYDIEQLEVELAPKMVVFAREYAKGGETIKDSARRAGYSERSLTQRGTQLVQHSGVCKLISAYKRADMLQNGMPMSWKRHHLQKIVERESSPEAAKIAAIRLMSELDRDLGPQIGGTGQIVVNLNLGGNGVTVEGETLEHNIAAPLGNSTKPTGGDARNIPLEDL